MWLRASLLGDDWALDWCHNHDMRVTRAAGEGVNSAGGFLVPMEIENSIIELRDSAGVFRANASVRQMGSDIRYFPRRVGGLTAFFTAENAVISESNASWDSIGLSAKKLSVLTRASSELWEDEAVNLGEYFTEEIAYAFARKEDDCGFAGDGTSTYGGMVGIVPKINDGTHTAGVVSATATHHTYLTLDATDISNLMATLPGRFWNNAKFYMSGYAYAQSLGRLAQVAGLGVLIGDTDASGVPITVPNYAGIPVAVTPSMPGAAAGDMTSKIMMLFGDLRAASLLGSRRGVTVQQSSQRYFDQDQMGIMASERFDISNHGLGDNTNAGPMVALIGTA
jgi:HK97 family phage major capsid protein